MTGDSRLATFKLVAAALIAATGALPLACRDALGIDDKVYRAPWEGGVDVDSAAVDPDSAALDADPDVEDAGADAFDASSDAPEEAGSCSPDLESDPENCGRCGRSCGGEICQSGRCPVMVLAPFTGLYNYGIAEQGDYVYWTAIEQGAVPHSVNLVSKQGGERIKIFTSNEWEANHPSGILVEGSVVYWSSFWSGSIYRANLAGTAPVTDVTLLATTTIPVYLASDATWLYTANYAAAIDMGGVSRIGKQPGAGASQIINNQAHPIGIAVDDTFVFWTVRDLATGVWRANKDGSSRKKLASGTIASEALAIDDQWVFWHDRANGALLRFEKDGSNPVMIASETSDVLSIVADGDRVYWFAREIGRVRSVRKDGSELLTLAVDQEQGEDAGRLAVDATHVYWIASHQLKKTVK